MNLLPNSQFWDRVMRGIEWLMVGLFLILAYQLLIYRHWGEALGVMAGSLILASNAKPYIKIPVILSLIVFVEIALKS